VGGRDTGVHIRPVGNESRSRSPITLSNYSVIIIQATSIYRSACLEVFDIRPARSRKRKIVLTTTSLELSR
jgi:hypothetical protein